MPIYFYTPNEREYNFLPNRVGYIHFKVKASNTVCIVLTPGPSLQCPMYTVVIGSNENSMSRISNKGYDGPNLVEVQSYDILDGKEERGFWMKWGNCTVSVGKENEAVPFMTCTDSKLVPIKYFGFCTCQGATGDWTFEIKQCGCPTKPRPGGPGSYWVERKNGAVPKNAFVGCTNGDQDEYIIRGHFLIPGKLIPREGHGLINWCKKELDIHEYEMLTDFKGDWIKTSGSNIPPDAVIVGKDFEGRPIYIGRTNDNGVLALGAVKASKGLNASINNEHRFFEDYEILVRQS